MAEVNNGWLRQVCNTIKTMKNRRLKLVKDVPFIKPALPQHQNLVDALEMVGKKYFKSSLSIHTQTEATLDSDFTPHNDVSQITLCLCTIVSATKEAL